MDRDLQLAGGEQRPGQLPRGGEDLPLPAVVTDSIYGDGTVLVLEQLRG